MYTRDPDFSKLPEILKLIKPHKPWAIPTEKVVRVSAPWEIIRAVEDAEEYTTIVIAKGRYIMPRDMVVNTHHLTICGETGDREDVIIDGDTEFDQFYKPLSTRFGAPGLIKITRARHLTIRDLTLANSPKYGIMFMGDGRVDNLTIENVKFHNIWARGLKGTGSVRIDHVPYTEDELGYNPQDDYHIQWNRPKNGCVRHCLFINDRPKQDEVDPDEGNYVAGMDLMFAKGWTISDNAFVGIRGKSGRGRGTVFIWIHSEDVVVENNIFIHCDKAIGLGNPHAQDRASFHIRNTIVRNNIIIGGCNKAIEIDYGNNVTIESNKICSEDRKDYHAIQVLNMSESAIVKNNIIGKDPLDAFNVDSNTIIEDNEVTDLVGKIADLESGDFSMK